MNRIKFPYHSKLLFLVCVTIIIVVAGCKEEFETFIHREGSDSRLIINIPNYIINETDLDKGNKKSVEGNINSLWICAFHGSIVGDKLVEEGTPIIYKLSLSDRTEKQDDLGYTSYSIPFNEGYYKIYILANLESYLKGGENDIKKIKEMESIDLESLTLDFSNVDSNQGLDPGNLPMICLCQEIDEADKTTGVFHFSSSANSIRVNLTYLCSKIRYTILFDSSASASPEGFSQAFGNNKIDFSTTVESSKIGNETKLSYDSENENYLNQKWNHSLLKKQYPANGPLYPEYSSVTGHQSDLESVTAEIDRKHAWQGTVYLPERRVNGEESTRLSFEAYIGPDADASLSKGEKTNYEMLLFKEEKAASDINQSSKNGNNKGLERGKFYDVVVKIINYESSESEFNINVSDWNIRELSYQLQDGPVELELETAEIEVKSGESTSFWYQSNITPEEINNAFESPEIIWQGQVNSIPLYLVEVVKDQNPEKDGSLKWAIDENGRHIIRVKINPKIPYSVLEEFKNGVREIEDINFFHIVVGNIHKRIDIKKLEFKQYFNISPQNLTISIRDLIAEGVNTKNFPILFETNVIDKRIMLHDPDNLVCLKGEEKDFPITITGESVGFIDNKYYITTSGGVLNLKLIDLINGNPYWKTSKEYKISFLIDGINDSNELNIKIIPYTTDYIIHFKSNNKSYIWEAPHIFVYQNLELPYDLEIDDDRKGKKIGYQEGTNIKPAYEYCFTGDIAFKGWYGYGGPQVNDPYEEGFQNENWTQDYFIFKDKVLGSANMGDSYNPFIPNSQRYFTGMHFNDMHISSIGNDWKCVECQLGEWTNKHVPGIVMEYEGNGWWKYVLSGIASPYKTLIVFSDTHELKKQNNSSTDNNRYRFPASSKNGIPLFNYEDKEGWFLFDGLVTSNSHTNPQQYFYDDGSINDGIQQ